MHTIPRVIVLALTAGVFFFSLVNVFGQEAINANTGRMEARIQALSRRGANPEGGVSRVALSDADLAGRAYIIALINEPDVSPSPKEFTSPQEMANGASVLLRTVLAVDGSGQ